MPWGHPHRACFPAWHLQLSSPWQHSPPPRARPLCAANPRSVSCNWPPIWGWETPTHLLRPRLRAHAHSYSAPTGQSEVRVWVCTPAGAGGCAQVYECVCVGTDVENTTSHPTPVCGVTGSRRPCLIVCPGSSEGWCLPVCWHLVGCAYLSVCLCLSRGQGREDTSLCVRVLLDNILFIAFLQHLQKDPLWPALLGWSGPSSGSWGDPLTIFAELSPRPTNILDVGPWTLCCIFPKGT